MVFKTADVKAEGGVGFGQKGLMMMELQSLQEALKVEIQIHQKLVAQMKQDPQNAELKLQLHDLQAKITALSERQKKVVEQLRRDLLVKQESAEIRLQTQAQLPLQADGKTTTLVSNPSQGSLPPAHLSTPQNSVSVTPVIATKTLPLMLRAATPTTPIAMMPTPTIAMVTTLSNTPLPSLPNSDPQNLPVSLQSSCKPTDPVRIAPRNAIVVQTTTQPIKVPQFVPPTRQTARPASLPQVMPKPPAPVAPAALQPVLACPQQPVYLTAKLSSTLLPSSGPVHQLHIFNPQPVPAITQPSPAITQASLSHPQPSPVITQASLSHALPGPVITQTSPSNPQPGLAVSQMSSSVSQPGSAITQTSPAVSVMLSTNVSQFSMSGVQSRSQQSSVHLSAQACNTAHLARASQPATDTAHLARGNQPTPDTAHLARSSQPAPDSPALLGVCQVEPQSAPSGPTALSSPTPRANAPPSPASTSTLASAPSPANKHNPVLFQSLGPKRQDNPLKLAFMVSLGLVTHDYLEEIQSKRQERKRRTTANPVYSGAIFEPERKKSTVSYLTSANQAGRTRGRPPKHGSAVERGVRPLTPTRRHAGAEGPHAPPLSLTPSSHPPPFRPPVSPSSVGDGDIHDDFCVVCRRGGQLLMCDTCSRVYHPDSQAPALCNLPRGMRICPSCQNQISKSDEALEWPGPLAIVHSYISYKAEREQEKQKLEKWNTELQQEREELELRVKHLSSSMTICRESRNGVLARQREMEASIEKVKCLVRLIRGIQLPSLVPAGVANGGWGPATPQHPSVNPEENRHPDGKCGSEDGTSIGHLVIVSSVSADPGETPALSDIRQDDSHQDDGHQDDASARAQSSIPELAADAVGGKSIPATHCGCTANSCPTLSNSASSRVAGPNGHEESRSRASDVNKSSADMNRNSIRGLRGSAEPPLPAVRPLTEVIQGME